MEVRDRSLAAAVLLLLVAAPLPAQTATDPSGHWQGTVNAQGTEIPFAIDIATISAGRFAGTVSVPAQKITSLPLTKIAVDGTALTFQARSDQPFTATLSDDRQSMSGDFHVDDHALPFVLSRAGDAAIAPRPKSAPIGKDLEGTWTATIESGGVSRHLSMTLINNPDGTASGQVVHDDEGGLELPVTVARHGASVTIETVPIASTFTATLNDDATELRGTVAQGPETAPLTFRRAQ